jgi:hypothetical protein
VAFIAYALLGITEGVFDKVLPILVLHVSLFVLNARRIREAARRALATSESGA